MIWGNHVSIGYIWVPTLENCDQSQCVTKCRIMANTKFELQNGTNRRWKFSAQNINFIRFLLYEQSPRIVQVMHF